MYVGVGLVFSLFFHVVLSVQSSFAIKLLGKLKIVALFYFITWRRESAIKLINL